MDAKVIGNAVELPFNGVEEWSAVDEAREGLGENTEVKAGV